MGACDIVGLALGFEVVGAAVGIGETVGAGDTPQSQSDSYLGGWEVAVGMAAKMGPTKAEGRADGGLCSRCGAWEWTHVRLVPELSGWRFAIRKCMSLCVDVYVPRNRVVVSRGREHVHVAVAVHVDGEH